MASTEPLTGKDGDATAFRAGRIVAGDGARDASVSEPGGLVPICIALFGGGEG